jgi:uncharacterized sulfatase
MAPANPTARAAGALPSAQLFTESDDEFTPSGNPVQYNIFMIMVDQMRQPKWYPPQYSSAGSFLEAVTPNIYANIYSKAFQFTNYFTAATNCTPARSTLLTGPYTQQTCMFQADSSSADPVLMPANTSATQPLSGNQVGFPTFANAPSNISQWTSNDSLKSYNCAWVGKWHLSAENETQSCDLAPYGFGQNLESLRSAGLTKGTPAGKC